MPSPVPQVKTVSRMMSFADACKEILAGNKVTKMEWKNPAEYFLLHNGKLSVHHSGDPDDVYHILMVSDGDMLGIDYMLITEEKSVKN